MRLRLILFAALLLALSLTVNSDSPAGLVASSKNIPVLVSPAGNATVQMLLSSARTGNSQIYLGKIQFQPDAKVPEHVHETSEELVYILQGKGQLVIRGQEYSVAAGDAVYIPRNTPHSFSNNGSEAVEAIQVYSPAGPEQRFLEWRTK